MIETRLLHYFLAVARERNITNAAKVLHITQPTLSRQMTLLEQEIGAKLFVRESRPLSLTEEGTLLLRRAEEILELLQKTQEEIQTHEQQIEGTISIGCGELAAAKLLTETMAKFSDKYPRVVFDIFTANADHIKRRMDEGLTDLGLLLEPVDIERYEYIRLPVRERWVAVMPAKSPLAKQQYVTAKELVDVPVIMPGRQKVYDEVASWFGDDYEKLHIVGASNLSTNAALMVRAGMGYALIVEGGLPLLGEEEICMRPLEPKLTATSVLAWKRSQPFSAAVNCFIEYFKSSLQGLPYDEK